MSLSRSPTSTTPRPTRYGDRAQIKRKKAPVREDRGHNEMMSSEVNI
jgi:hypothetical protein